MSDLTWTELEEALIVGVRCGKIVAKIGKKVLSADYLAMYGFADVVFSVPS